MGSNYKKIKYETQGSYGSVEQKNLYIKSSRTNDFVSFYDENGDEIFSFDEFADFNMGEAIKIALTNWNDEKMENVSIEEIKMIDKIQIDEDFSSPYCKICGGCGEDGCCSAMICKQHPDGDYCKTYLNDLKFGYLMFDEIDKILPKDSDFKKKYEELFDKVYDLVYLKK